MGSSVCAGRATMKWLKGSVGSAQRGNHGTGRNAQHQRSVCRGSGGAGHGYAVSMGRFSVVHMLSGMGTSVSAGKVITRSTRYASNVRLPVSMMGRSVWWRKEGVASSPTR
jgi:hypothetical protein